ncbi:RsiV family protein [Parapedobacter sp. 2B3]|uniref:RsiV family protein n=1 Tax=Parapedobacter sp. 2B3 TaxID=3342381 RepID=UPI0035B5DC11
MKLSKLYIYGLIGILLMEACQLNTDKEKTQAGKPAADTLAYAYEDYIKYSSNLIKTSETTDTTFFAASYPVFDEPTADRFVRMALLGNDTTTVAEAAGTFIGEFDRFFASDPFPRVWTSASHAKVYSITPTYLALAIHASSYTGGAHGNYATIFKHYDLQANEPLALGDIVNPSFQNELTAVAERYFRNQENLGVNQPLEGTYFFDDGRFSLPDNFALESDSMLFLYNIYEIKPYVNGQTELRVPYADLERLLTDRAKRIITELNTPIEP